MMMVIIMMNMTMMVMMAMVVMMVNGREQGWQGVNCSSRCSKSSWGEKCRETCDCEYGTCHPDNGRIHSIFIPDKFSTNIIFFLSILYPGNCICERGFTGRRCDMPCPHVTFWSKKNQQHLMLLRTSPTAQPLPTGSVLKWNAKCNFEIKCNALKTRSDTSKIYQPPQILTR